MPRPLRLLQANLNHSVRAQDLFVQALAEWDIGVGIAAEPYHVPARFNWLGDDVGSVAVVVTAAANAPPPSLVGRGEGYVAVEVGGTTVVGMYFSPNRDLAAFEDYLGEVGAVINRLSPSPVVALGDLNAKSEAWGSPGTDPRGEAVEEWAAGAGLLLLNRGSVHTCVRQRGGSVVDVSFATPAVARMVRDWRVLEGVETLSDHRYIRIDVSTPREPVPGQGRRPGGAAPSPRWALKRLDRDALMEASAIRAWLDPPAGPVEVAAEVEWFGASMTQICDASMPRTGQRRPQTRRQVYWWSDEIASLREACVVVRRRYTRYRRRRCRDGSVEAELYGSYREATKTLQLAIRRAKAQAWDELLETLDRDPWGRPYRMVRGKLRAWAPPVTESLHPRVLEDVVSALFPGGGAAPPARAPPDPVWDGEPGPGVPPVRRGELEAAVRRMGAKSVAPGPDGVPGKAWALALSALGDRLRRLFTGCLSTGWFPPKWKRGRLVLLKKEGRPAESPSAYRPICLLDEVGKLFERVLAARLVEHLARVGPDLAECQYGFREGRSTIDAIMRVRALSERAVSRGGVALAVSLDIANAFNTLPWARIREALRYHGVPPYLQRILGAYLSQRYIEYQGRCGTFRRETFLGVPQGSVLGPLLWNLGYNWVLRGALLPGIDVVCYADDTLVVARGDNGDEAAALARRGVAIVVGRIRALGLEVALHKTEALWFHGPRRRPASIARLECGGSRVGIGTEMKYLGLVLDGRWNFRAHFGRLAPRVRGAAGSLSRLLPNLGGPGDGCRRLYEGTVRSIALYGAPVWAGALAACEASLAHLRGAQRLVAVRAIRGYRTVSFEAACLLAGTPPWDLVAESHAATYEWRVGLRSRGERPTPRGMAARRIYARRLVLQKWQERSAHPRAGLRAVGAVQPILEEWVDRRWGQLTFRLVQVLSGHGCFGEYLCRTAGREPTTRCHECGGDRDTAQHTLEECPEWAAQRRVLVAAVGPDLSLPAVVSAMVGGEGAWQAMASFCEEVISQKEAAERERELDPGSLPARRGRGGARRRRYERLLA